MKTILIAVAMVFGAASAVFAGSAQVNTPAPQGLGSLAFNMMPQGGLSQMVTETWNDGAKALTGHGQLCPDGAISDSPEDCPAAYSSISAIVQEKEQAMTDPVACPGNYSGDNPMECLHFTAELLAQIGKGMDSHDFSTNVEASADVKALMLNLEAWANQENPDSANVHIGAEVAGLQFKATVLSIVLDDTFKKIAKERIGL